MDTIDAKYIGLVSSRLQKFKKVKADLYNFRCPICGDSQKHKNKARGYMYPVKADMNFKCHNCGASSTFSNFIKTLDPVLYKQYIFEKFKTRNTGKGSLLLHRLSCGCSAPIRFRQIRPLQLRRQLL